MRATLPKRERGSGILPFSHDGLTIHIVYGHYAIGKAASPSVVSAHRAELVCPVTTRIYAEERLTGLALGPRP